ncbi:hypothetical protein [Coleofasciculus sp. F4-SAH-05]|uniref:hypothetical protein n=1 Tax=Coleofasciculus sp. F4-SAH-05 TaxID=3069525 RepID=UPI0032F862CE
MNVTFDQNELALHPETVGAHVGAPIKPSNLTHNFSCVSLLLAWHTLIDGLAL